MREGDERDHPCQVGRREERDSRVRRPCERLEKKQEREGEGDG